MRREEVWDLVARVEGLVVFHELARMSRGVQHHTPLYLGAVRALHVRAAILVLHPLHFGQLESDTCSNRAREL